MSRSLQAKIVAMIFAMGALGLVGVIADDWLFGAPGPAAGVSIGDNAGAARLQPVRSTRPAP
jgi:hypothetical protein